MAESSTSSQITKSSPHNFLYRHQLKYVQRETIPNPSLSKTNCFTFHNEKVVFNPEEMDSRKRFYLRVGGVIELSYCFYDNSYHRILRLVITPEVFVHTNKFHGNWLLGAQWCLNRNDPNSDTIPALTFCTTGLNEKPRKIIQGKRQNRMRSTVASKLTIINSIIPRYSKNMDMIVGMYIRANDQNSDREWTRDVNGSTNFNGFYEIRQNRDYMKDFNEFTNWNEKRPKHDKYRLFGFYVGDNTSLVMLDVFQKVEFDTTGRSGHNRTLFQSGSFVYIEAFSIHFRFCNETFFEAVRSSTLKFITHKEYEIREHRLNVGKLNYDIKYNDKILFLQQTPYLNPWVISIVDDESDYDRRKVVLQVSSGSRIERILSFRKGIEEVIERQNQNPWYDYVQPVIPREGSHELLVIPRSNQFPRLRLDDSNEVTEELYNTLVKGVDLEITYSLKKQSRNTTIEEIDQQIIELLKNELQAPHDVSQQQPSDETLNQKIIRAHLEVQLTLKQLMASRHQIITPQHSPQRAPILPQIQPLVRPANASLQQLPQPDPIDDDYYDNGNETFTHKHLNSIHPLNSMCYQNMQFDGNYNGYSRWTYDGPYGEQRTVLFRFDPNLNT